MKQEIPDSQPLMMRRVPTVMYPQTQTPLRQCRNVNVCVEICNVEMPDRASLAREALLPANQSVRTAMLARIPFGLLAALAFVRTLVRPQ